MSTQSAVALRHLGSVANLAALLTKLEPKVLDSGSMVFVDDQASYYRYDPTSTATQSSPDVLNTQYGSGVAGRWLRGVGGSMVPTVPSTAVVAFGQLAASGVTSASVAFAGLAVNDSILVNPRLALAQGIAYARCATVDQLIIGLNNAATTTIAAQTVTFDVAVFRN